MIAFRYLLRVRYGECDAQGIVFNARWAEYVDIAASEYTRALFGSVDPAVTGIDWRLVKQTLEWRAPGRYDDVLDIRVRTLRVGTTSFALATEFCRHGETAVLATAETIYVVVDPAAGVKRPVPEACRAALERGAPGVVVDHAAAEAGNATRAPRV
ncbi:MAG TPA: thioesterase family protein [Kofleriaceae bacterium]|nr:thioesterase family protein [Kofleriaceae bacterium]